MSKIQQMLADIEAEDKLIVEYILNLKAETKAKAEKATELESKIITATIENELGIIDEILYRMMGIKGLKRLGLYNICCADDINIAVFDKDCNKIYEGSLGDIPETLQDAVVYHKYFNWNTNEYVMYVFNF